MTDQNDNEPAFTDTPDPYQARNGRREALQAALHLMNGKGEAANAKLLVTYASQIDAYLEDGSIPDATSPYAHPPKGETSEQFAERVSGIINRGGGSQSIHG
ncbi:hypothetical protein SEA_ZOOMAN_170 [Microbacterium phage Zooman]|nr:hypothetical protein SEA_ZOOMAN_170 [Microbacterium phage Zooman]